MQANFDAKKPITTHEALWLVPWPAADVVGALQTPVRLTEAGNEVESFGFVAGADPAELVITTTNSLLRDSEKRTAVLDLAKGGESQLIAPDVFASSVLPVALAVGAAPAGSYATVSEREGQLQKIVLGKAEGLELPHPQHVYENDFRLETLQYSAKDGTPLAALLCQRKSGATKGLLVHVHGGPAIALTADLSAAIGHTRYPYRHLLAAGFAVLTPAFRGTLGFGDDFAAANVGQQGKADLQDVMDGIQHVRDEKLLEENALSKVGIFGGSYGGYLTLRASSEHPAAFAAAVSMWPFVSNRYMTLEGGDFTWEEEYISEVTTADGKIAWPLTAEDESSDVFHQLHKVRMTLLLADADGGGATAADADAVAHADAGCCCC